MATRRIRVGAGRFFQRERVSRYTLVANAPFAVTSNLTRPLDSTVPLPTVAARRQPVVWIRLLRFQNRGSGT